MNTKLNSLALGYAGAILSELVMILIWILGNMGYYSNAVMMMQDWHMFFDLSFIGLIGGSVEAVVVSFVTLYIFGWIYNQFVQERSD